MCSQSRQSGKKRWAQPALRLGGDGQRHSFFSAHLDALFDGILDVLPGFFLGFPLADAARYSRTLCYVHAVFITGYGYYELHITFTLMIPDVEVGNAYICLGSLC
jgi:hypothetical protein